MAPKRSTTSKRRRKGHGPPPGGSRGRLRSVIDLEEDEEEDCDPPRPSVRRRLYLSPTKGCGSSSRGCAPSEASSSSCSSTTTTSTTTASSSNKSNKISKKGVGKSRPITMSKDKGLKGGRRGSSSSVDQVVELGSLPEEILLEIFDYLGFGDRLNVRCVSRTFANVISNWSGFNSNVVYLVQGGTESRSILRQTSFPWKRIRIEKFKLNEKGFGNIHISQNLSEECCSVEFSKSVVSWEALRAVLLKFNALSEFKITQCKRRRKEVTSPIAPFRFTRAGVQGQESLGDALKSLSSVSFELRRISDMLFYLNQLSLHGVSRLVSISLKDVYDGIECVTQENASELLAAFYKLVEASAGTLKVIRIHFVTLSVVNKFCIEFLGRVVESKLPLDLSVFELKHFAPEPQNNQDLVMYSSFINSQRNIKEISYPLPGDVPSEICRLFNTKVNQGLTKATVTSDKYMIRDFLDHFSSLKHFSCDFDIRQFILRGQVYHKLGALEISSRVLNSTVPLITESFPNLTRLNLNGNCEQSPPIDDRCLQSIIQQLKSLRFLVIGACRSITDYGVTGIRKEYCEKLFKSRAICLDPTMDIPREEISGSPISSLKALTHLTFTGATSVTDVGIYYGFRFVELRNLSLRHNMDISDWGLDWLGKWNPNIDWLYLGCGPWVTTVGINRLRCRLRRIKRRNSIWIWPNQEYYSSDESYAMESDEN